MPGDPIGRLFATASYAQQIVFADGETLGTVVNWSNHPEAQGSNNQLVSSDFPHATREVLERDLGGTSVYFSGSVGGLMTPLGVNILSYGSSVSWERTYEIGRLVAWLKANGRWDDTQENAWTMESLVDFYRKYEAETPDFVARVWLGEHRASSGRLYDRIREVRGLNYGDYAYIEFFNRPGAQFFPSPGIGRRSAVSAVK